MKRLTSIVICINLCFFSSVSILADNNFKSEKAVNKNDPDIVKGLVEKNKEFKKKIKADKDFEIIFDDGDGNFSFTTKKDLKKSKDEITAKLSDYSSQYSWSSSMSAYKSLDYSNGIVSSELSSNVNLSYPNIFSDDILAISGNSRSYWSGTNPFNASSIDQSDSFSCNYVGLSCTVSYPPGIGISGSNSSCSINYPQITNSYVYNHSYGTVSFKSSYITSASQTDASTFRFGTNTITPVATSYINMPSH